MSSFEITPQSQHFNHVLEPPGPLSQQWTTRDEIRYIDGLGTWTMRKHGVASRHVLLRRYLTVARRRPTATWGESDVLGARRHAQKLLDEALAEQRG